MTKQAKQLPLLPLGGTKGDLHVHTMGDAFIKPKELVKRAQERGLDFVVVTNHHYTVPALKLAEECRELGFLVLAGCEYSTDDGHLLVFLPEGMTVEGFLYERWGMYPKAQKCILDVYALGGVVVPAHPYHGAQGSSCYRRRAGMGDDLVDLVCLHVIEGVNGRQVLDGMSKRNDQALALAKDNGWGVTGGSDAHGPWGIGDAYTEFDRPITCQDDLIRELKSGDHKAVANVKARQWDQVRYWNDIEPRKTQPKSYSYRGEGYRGEGFRVDDKDNVHVVGEGEDRNVWESTVTQYEDLTENDHPDDGDEWADEFWKDVEGERSEEDWEAVEREFDVRRRRAFH